MIPEERRRVGDDDRRGFAQQAAERVNISFAGLIRDVEYPAQRTGMGDTDRQAFQKRQIYLQDGARGANSNRRQIQVVFALLFAVTGFVLAIACASETCVVR